MIVYFFLCLEVVKKFVLSFFFKNDFDLDVILEYYFLVRFESKKFFVELSVELFFLVLGRFKLLVVGYKFVILFKKFLLV